MDSGFFHVVLYYFKSERLKEMYKNFIVKNTELSGILPKLFTTEKSQEKRLGSIFIACLVHIPEFARAFGNFMPRGTVGTISLKKGLRGYMEVQDSEKNVVPDALILKDYPKNNSWAAIFEFKVGHARIDESQIEQEYLFATRNNIQALITVSNEFTATPSHIPYKIKTNKKVALYHFAWVTIQTIVHVLLTDEGNSLAPMEKVLLSQFQYFMQVKESGCLRFTKMPNGWSSFVNDVNNRTLECNNLIDSMVCAWHQKVEDLCLELARISNQPNIELVTRRLKLSNKERVQQTKERLLKQSIFNTAIDIPLLPFPVEIEVNLGSKRIYFKTCTTAPGNVKTPKGALGWLRKGLGGIDTNVIHLESVKLEVRWINTRKKTSGILKDLFEKNTVVFLNDMKGRKIKEFTLIYCVNLEGSFKNNRKFISILDKETKNFYRELCYHLPVYHPPAKLIEQDKEKSPEDPSYPPCP